MGRIFKEIFILLLLGLIILFTLSMLFYDFFHSTQELPEIKEYIADSNVKSTIQEIELNLENVENGGDSLLKSYEIVSADLKKYVSKKSYQQGKANPFVEYSTTEPTTNASGTTNDTQSTNNTNTNENKNSNTNSNQGVFFEKSNSK